MHSLSLVESQMEAFGVQLAAAMQDRGWVVYLTGPLGSGKSTLARATLRAMGVTGHIKSPTYTLIEPYDLVDGRQAFHLDLYRLADPEELEFLGFRDLLGEGSVVFIEWPERGGDDMPAPDLRVAISRERPDARTIHLEPGSDAGKALLTRLISVS